VARRKVLTGLLLALGSLFGALVFRRRFARRRARVDLYYEDGSMRSVAEGSSQADEVLTLARDLLRDVRA
jgi:hypothetical protein